MKKIIIFSSIVVLLITVIGLTWFFTKQNATVVVPNPESPITNQEADIFLNQVIETDKNPIIFVHIPSPGFKMAVLYGQEGISMPLGVYFVEKNSEGQVVLNKNKISIKGDAIHQFIAYVSWFGEDQIRYRRIISDEGGAEIQYNIFNLESGETTTTDSTVYGAKRVFRGEKFFFLYPARYTSSDIGLWTEGRYEQSLNPRENSDFDRLPDIAIFSETSDKTVKEFFEDKIQLDFDKTTGESMSFSEDQVGGRTYYKINDWENMEVSYYVMKYENRIIGFKTFDGDKKEDDIIDMLSFLEFFE